jgi:hypothetical protein
MQPLSVPPVSADRASYGVGLKGARLSTTAGDARRETLRVSACANRAERSSADHSSGQSPREDGDGEEPRAQWLPVNADADRAAAAVAAALDAELVVLTDVDGVYADPDDPETRIGTVTTGAEWETLQSAAEGFMTRKVMAAEEALDGGAASVAIASANADAPVTSALDGDATTIAPTALSSDPGEPSTEVSAE